MQRDMVFWRSAYDAHGGAVLSFLARKLGRREEAEDLLQETFVRAIRCGTFREGNLRGYLLRIAHNLLVSRLRRPRLVVPAEDGGAFDELPAAGGSPEEAAAWGDLRARLAAVLAELSDAHRRAFELAVLRGLPYAEIAARTGWSAGQVRINVFRARKKVVEALAEHLPRTRRSLS